MPLLVKLWSPLVRPPISTHSPDLVIPALKDCSVGKGARRPYNVSREMV
jgi:hypothetical protein